MLLNLTMTSPLTSGVLADVLAALVLLEFESSDDLSEPLGDELPDDAATSTLVLLNSISWKSVWRQLGSSVLQNLHDTSSDFPEHCSCHRAIHRACTCKNRFAHRTEQEEA